MQRENRKLAAIVAADIADYSRLICQDDEGTLRDLPAHQQELIDRLIDAPRAVTIKCIVEFHLRPSFREPYFLVRERLLCRKYFSSKTTR